MKFFDKTNPNIRYVLLWLILQVCLLTASVPANSPNANGVVYEDADRNQKSDPDERGIPGVLDTSGAEDKFMVIIIDGARYTETFGDPNHTYIPRMRNLSTQGTYLTHFYNDSVTYTSRAIPALWCGSWTEVRDTTYNGHNTQYALKPTIFEYFRAQKNLPEEECYYVLKYISNLWLPSFHPD